MWYLITMMRTYTTQRFEVSIRRRFAASSKICAICFLIMRKHRFPRCDSDSREPDRPTPTAVDMTRLLCRKPAWFFQIRNSQLCGVITETATPSLREMFHRHLQNAIKMHTKVLNFMLERNYYPAYHMDQLLAGDLKNAKAALSM
jgi:spore coat protein F